MSEAGLLIRNDNDNLLINADYNNLYLFRKIKLTSMSYEVVGNGSASPLRFTIGIQDNEIIAPIARTNGKELMAVSMHGAGTPGTPVGSWLIYVPRYKSSIAEILADLDNVYVYTFGINTSTTKTGNYGLQVFDASGVCVFNSNNKPMRVLHYANNVGDTNKTDAELDGYTIPSNRVCAIFNCAVVRIAAGAQATTKPVFFLNAYISDNGKVLQESVFSGGAAPFNFIMGDYIGYMVVDVTGY